PLRETYKVLKEIYDIPDDQFNKRMLFLNEILELNDFIKDPVRTLSLGQRMRADIAASLLHNPKVLFLDEPTIGLDVSVKDNIRRAIIDINKEENTTIVLTTHDLTDIELLCSRIFMIDKGQEVFDGSISQLKNKFGRMHEISFQVANIEEVFKLNYTDFFENIDMEINGVNINICFDATKIHVTELLQFTLSRTQINDVSVKDGNIEEIIKRFFRKEIEND
ncbi:ATP-binding cassette domain-containing protein, partial [Enterococcus rivorum]